MKKNLAKKVTLSILAGAMLMSSSVAWADNLAVGGDHATVVKGYDGSIAVGQYSIVYGNNSIAIGIGAGSGTYTQVGASDLEADNAIAIGSNAKVTGDNSVALGAKSKAIGYASVALGYGSIVGNTVTEPVVSVGSGNSNDAYGTRSIINVTDVSVSDLCNTTYGSYAVNVNTLNDALSGYVKKEAMNDGSSTTNVTDTFNVVETIVNTNTKTTTVTINATDEDKIVMDKDGITVGQNSTRIDGTGVYVWDDTGYDSNNPNPHNKPDAIAAVTNDGTIKGVNGTFSGNVTAANFVTSSGINIATELGVLDTKVQANSDAIANKAEKSYVDDELAKKADKSALEAEKTAREQADQDLQTQIVNIGGGAIASINQRLDKTNAKINKVGAGAAALAALHPLEYDPDDKLTFSAGMGNYAGENAAALGAFYRPNEKFMVSLGGTMGNGENMVNLGLSIGLDKPNGYAKLSKRELIQEVNAVKAENEAIKADNEAMKAEMAEMKAMLQAILAKK